MKLVKSVNNFNKSLAILITETVSTMWCAYAFTLLTLVSLPAAIKGGIPALITWIAQTFLQLVLLSIIMVGQNVLSEKNERRAEEDHETIMKEFAVLNELHESHADEMEELKKMHKELHTLINEVNLKVSD
jgi:hypothetical protein